MRSCALQGVAWLFAALCAACSGPESGAQETFEVIEGQDTFRGTGSLRFLSKSELAAYHSDHAYLRRLVRAGEAVELNHADPRQHRFALARVRMSGKTPENSPALFHAMADLAREHAARGLVAGSVQAQAIADGSWQSQHEMLSLGKTALGSTTIATSSLASRKDQLTHGFVDCSAYDGEGNAIGDYEYIEVFGNMKFFAPQCHGDMALASVNSAEGDSFLSETIASTGKVKQSYVLGSAVAFDALLPALGAPTVDEPKDRNNDDKISVCLDRVWTGDCDVNNTGFATLKVPLKGSVSISNATFDWATIAHYQTDRPDTFSRIFVTLVTNGGGCSVPPTASSFAMKDFWKQVTGTGNQLSWDLSTDATKWAQFSSQCRLVQDQINLTMQLRLPYQSPDTSGTIALEITTAGNPPPPNYKIEDPIQVTNSCLAEGTLIATPGRAVARIEDIRIGDTIASPYAASLTVTDTAAGSERSAMIRIADRHGRELLMTDMHPLYVAGRGMVPARQVSVGDRVHTLDGPSELVRVSRENFTGRVYNLKVGNAQEVRSLEADQTAVYANGFLVGDGQIQNKYQFMNLARDDGAVRIPASWKADYLASVRRARL